VKIELFFLLIQNVLKWFVLHSLNSFLSFSPFPDVYDAFVCVCSIWKRKRHLAHLLKYVGYYGAAFHDLHHSGVDYNFGSFIWWDRICGTFVSPQTTKSALSSQHKISIKQ
jgi:sterol desaturase/sphingolipid hydroxylase (fatty acid hydroxylase superfamily)